MAFRVLQLVAMLAQCLKLSLASVWVKHAQSQVRALPKVLDVMHDVAPPKPPGGLANLAFVVIQA